ncbi:MAG: hypothetical protein AVDCRST_MAG87-1863 [uncultured Thermomicrobiales bacterium]|uniref:Uncharacterized protein n=1 Tax=uncultured Thermomicrobiales bacterium TaxID=1645740 RepID=A0A6J4V4W5_9BACT|nr:MAG: hypothetical protein AVDCRST_MAG87-1863 [uncultured Thermomicrobiales bacterium]
MTNGDQRDIFVETRDWQILEF